MLSSDELHDLHNTGLKYTVIRVSQGDHGLRFTVRMDKEMKIQKPSVEAEVIELKPITGGRDGTDNWLSKLLPGAVFLSRDKKMNVCICSQFHVKKKYEHATLLFSNFPEKEFYVFVKTGMFSAEQELVEILKEGTEDVGDLR